MLDSTPVVVVGGGIAGLSAAYELHRRNVPFSLLEAGDRAGGVVFSEQIDGFTIDGGPDSLLVSKPEAIKLCEELGLRDRLVPTKTPRIAYIQRGGRLHPLPAGSVLGIPTEWGPFLSSSLFSWAGKLRMGAELLIPARRDEGDESIGSFMTRRFGAEATVYLAEPLLAGIHAGDVDRLSILSLFPKFAEAERTHRSLLLAFRQIPRPPSSFQGVFRSLPGGLSEMVRALVAALPSDSVRLRCRVKSVARDPEGFRLETESGSIIAPAVILATPAFVTAPMTSAMSSDLSRLCAEIPYASAVTVAFAFPRNAIGHPLNGSGFVVPRVERTGIMAASWLSSKWPGRAPEGFALLRAFLGGARDPDAIGRSDAAIVKTALDALRPLLRITGEPILTRIYRWERANAQHEVGHLARMAAIDRVLRDHPGLYVTGSGFRGVGIPDCVADGRLTGTQVSSWLASSSAQ